MNARAWLSGLLPRMLFLRKLTGTALLCPASKVRVGCSGRGRILSSAVVTSDRRGLVGTLLQPIRAFASDEYNSSNVSSTVELQRRKDLLFESLESIGVEANALHEAAVQSISDPASGYDGRYGKSAIKAYRAFLYPKKKSANQEGLLDSEDPWRLDAAAHRCAQQVDFLLKRHRSHQAAWVRHHDAFSAEEVSKRKTFPIVLLLDNVRSAFNVGSLFRTADAAGCEELITTGITPHPNGSGADKVPKSALGAEVVVPSRHFATTREAIDFIREAMPTYRIVGMETTERSALYTTYEYPRNGTVLVLGNEVTGVDTCLLPELDAIVEIPMFGAKNSLNIAACAPVVLFEILRQWNATADFAV